MKTYHFYKTETNWYIDLPEYIEQGGTLGDLQMVDGADTMLEIMSENDNSVEITIAKQEFEKSDILELIEKCDPEIGGGYYLMRRYEEADINQMMWLCQVTSFVLNDIPTKIFVRRERRSL